MPRKYIPVGLQKKSAPNATDIEKALEELKNGTYKSLRKCAEKYNLSLTTLHRHLKLGNNVKKKMWTDSSQC